MICKKLIFLGISLVLVYSQGSSFGSDPGSVFADTFNFAPQQATTVNNSFSQTSTPINTSANVVSAAAIQTTPAELKATTLPIFSGSPYSEPVGTKTVSSDVRPAFFGFSTPVSAPLYKNPAENAFAQIKANASLSKRPSRTVIGSQNKQVYFLFLDQNGNAYRSKIASRAMANRLLDPSKNLLTVEQSTLNLIPQFINVDKYAQLISPKDQDQVFLVQHKQKRPINDSVFNQFGFWKSKVLQVEPCYIQLFSDGDWIR